jgi:alpha-beta hydrolase superfamily lysophospholipase
VLTVGAAARAARAQEPPPGLVILVSGVGGYDSLQLSAPLFLRRGLNHEYYNFVWTHGVGRLFRDLQDTAHAVRKAGELAAFIRARKEAEPNRPIFVVAKSGGCGVALLAAERLPPATLERMVLLSAAVSPGYDLRPALRATRAEIVSFYSRNDQFILRWGTSTFGTIDRHYGPAAGLTGFRVPPGLGDEDRALYDRLVQIAWRPRMLCEGYVGNHAGTAAPAFLTREVAPWLR